MKGERKIREWARKHDVEYGRCGTCKYYSKCNVCSYCSNGSKYVFDVENYDTSKMKTK